MIPARWWRHGQRTKLTTTPRWEMVCFLVWQLEQWIQNMIYRSHFDRLRFNSIEIIVTLRRYIDGGIIWLSVPTCVSRGNLKPLLLWLVILYPLFYFIFCVKELSSRRPVPSLNTVNRIRLLPIPWSTTINDRLSTITMVFIYVSFIVGLLLFSFFVRTIYKLH